MVGAGSKITGGSLIIGIIFIIIGALFSSSIIGALIGIPLILIGIAIMAGGTVGGATVGAVGTAYNVSKDITTSKNRNKTEKIHKTGFCKECGASKKGKFCEECGNKH